jgi:hypothetical protein
MGDGLWEFKTCTTSADAGMSRLCLRSEHPPVWTLDVKDTA